MLNKLLLGLRDKVEPNDNVICAVSGGVDSMALLWGMYLLKDQLGITLEAAHFNHCLRGEESDRDALFVQDFCYRFDIPLHLEKKQVISGEKGLEAAARDARYAFFETLQGKIATAHTADDNAETVLMHLVRGTGLKGLCGITPVRGNLIRPMLDITRQEVLAFLAEYSISYMEDSTNAGMDFLRNRIRHEVMPLLKRENPRLSLDMSSMARMLREDEAFLQKETPAVSAVSELKQLPPAIQTRAIVRLLETFGVFEPSRSHIGLVRGLVYSANPSARVSLPGGVVVERNYDQLRLAPNVCMMEPVVLRCPGTTQYGDILIHCRPGTMHKPEFARFVVSTEGPIVVRPRMTGDKMKLQGGTKSLKRIFSDKKIPASERCMVPVLSDDKGVLGVYGIGANLDRVVSNGCLIIFEKIQGERYE